MIGCFAFPLRFPPHQSTSASPTTRISRSSQSCIRTVQGCTFALLPGGLRLIGSSCRSDTKPSLSFSGWVALCSTSLRSNSGPCHIDIRWAFLVFWAMYEAHVKSYRECHMCSHQPRADRLDTGIAQLRCFASFLWYSSLIYWVRNAFPPTGHHRT